MKKIITFTAAIAAVATTTVASVAIAKKVKANKVAEIEAAMEAANTEPIAEPIEEETEEKSDLFNNFSKCENETESRLHFKTKEADETEEEEEPEYVNTYAPEGAMYQITAEYCPRTEDGDEAKTKHDTHLEFMDIVNTGIFVRRNSIDAVSTGASFDWENHENVIEEIEKYFRVTEWLEERNMEFTIDFTGYEFSSPIIMAHVGNDPKRSILIRARKVEDEDIF